MTEVLSSNIEENFDRFIVEALETGCVWGLEGPEGWALCPSEQYTETDVMPFWSQPEFAKQHCVEDWAVYQPVAVSVEEFMDKWLPGMHDDVYLVGINWDNEMEGMEIEPLDLLEEFENEIS
ncbi:DUF2750 domain-containing protein [Pseudoteredinibacter isoporae]|uniref:DUF2750 domain-containing protein n=1 Tax=Pseudoteredinibacter isoporae TaxID=570281 RepID=A0A7X0JQV4_9GAMM|nr:DUF2750 domain-containing protein [Pseudoteredinibacter isoporae]MBB6520632.1 hypothetical protein [Pseudoteredinibacter isoporae]NHO86199.1 DUF2750 domain-containing protein [Pseudoteredinibacter isoporae]NIB25350.1 DUF2750 domain-containing protein [Pseudoteredinibacter isoporae]